MDPVKEIEALETEREELEKLLAAPGISEAQRIAIRHNIVTVGAVIRKWLARLPPRTLLVCR